MYGGGGVMGGNIFGRCLDRSSVFIGNLHESTTEIDLRDEFRLYGKILNIHLIHKPTRYRAKRVFAFIKYETEVDAARAIDHEVKQCLRIMYYK
jgi:RNA recognition motif-containing protein